MFDFFLDSYLTICGVFKYYTFSKKFQFYNQKQVSDYQFKQLKILLIESSKHVPYYIELFKKINFDPISDFNSLKDLEKLPTLSKKAAKENRDKLINKRYINKSIKLKTSGSTGEPFHVLVSYNAWIIEQASIWRNWKWAGYSFRDKMAVIRSYAPKKGQALIKKDLFRNFDFYSPFHLSRENCEFYLSEIKRSQARFLRGYPSSIFLLANAVKSDDCFNIKGILTASETLTKNDRLFIESKFHTKIFNHYGLADICLMMGDCEFHGGLHNYEDYGYMELLDSGISPKFKNIVGTNLHNLAMPLIRYETGDIAELADTTCSCSRSFPIISNVIGRKDTNLTSPDGFSIPSVNFYTMFEHYDSIIKWQLVQISIFELNVYLLVNETFYHVLENTISDEIRKRFNYNMVINFIINDGFYKVNEGKQNPIISLF
jgi:phenylacetate-CoA ligase